MMKSKIILLILVLSINAFSQNNAIDFGGGEYLPQQHTDKCLTALDRSLIQTQLRFNQDSLYRIGKLNMNNDNREDVAFIWPLRKADGFEWNSYYGISNYVDQNPTSDLLGDYYCNERTYDGHKGTDIFTWPFPWYMYENNLVEIIAGEAGVIIDKRDGYEDDHCECFGSWNAVYVQHSDGSIAWYGHMKAGSLTSKAIGDEVLQGEFLGVVASSGCSSGPHLHLEVYDADNNLIDPYEGACNTLNENTWWADQEEDRVPTLNTLLTHDAIPEHGCPSLNEDPHMSNDFDEGDLLYTAFYYHDGLAGTVANYRLIDANGDAWETWSQTLPATYNASWWYWSYELPLGGPFGVWTLEADYQGMTYKHEFNYGVYAGIKAESKNDLSVYPNPSNTGIFHIGGLNEALSVKLFDVTGKLLQSLDIKNGKVDLSRFSKGVYFLSIPYKDEIVTLKLIKA